MSAVLLHAEDDDAAAYLFRWAVEEAKIPAVVFRVSDGDHALNFIRRRAPYTEAPAPDLLVLDLNMPRVDGWAVLRDLRQDEALASLPVVVLTTSRHPGERERAFDLGAREFITKPGTLDELVKAIDQVCSPLLPEAQ